MLCYWDKTTSILHCMMPRSAGYVNFKHKKKFPISRLSLFAGEGPFGLVMCPSRELARQTFDVMTQFTASLQHDRLPEVRCLLCMGGIDMREQSDALRKGVHCVVATPGRLKDMLAKKRLNLGLCRYLCLDEADRMVDMGFEEDIREVIVFFSSHFLAHP